MEALQCTAKPYPVFDMESTGLDMESTEVQALLCPAMPCFAKLRLDMESTEVLALLCPAMPCYAKLRLDMESTEVHALLCSGKHCCARFAWHGHEGHAWIGYGKH